MCHLCLHNEETVIYEIQLENRVLVVLWKWHIRVLQHSKIKKPVLILAKTQELDNFKALNNSPYIWSYYIIPDIVVILNTKIHHRNVSEQ